MLNALRAIPELIMGILFVAAVGFGALPGVLALGLHSVGMVGKFFAEAIEHADEAPIEAARAAGGTRLQVILHGVLPQALPQMQMADISIYRWEYNFRASTVMGMVGAGGIGFELMGSLRIMYYRTGLWCFHAARRADDAELWEDAAEASANRSFVRWRTPPE